MHSSHDPAIFSYHCWILGVPRKNCQLVVPSESKVCCLLLVFAHWFFMSCVSHNWGERHFLEFNHWQSPLSWPLLPCWLELRLHRAIPLGRCQVQAATPPPRLAHCSSLHRACWLCLSSLSSGMFSSSSPLGYKWKLFSLLALPFIWLSMWAYSGITGTWKSKFTAHFVDSLVERKVQEFHHHPTVSVDLVGVVGGTSLSPLICSNQLMVMKCLFFNLP